MSSYLVWVYIHILLFVFWIGTDVGVFVLGKFAQSAKYSVEQRLLAIKIGLLIDRFPRVCFVLIVPVGLQMAHMSGLLPLSATVHLAVWLAAAFWLAVVFLGFAVEGKPIAAPLRNIERGLQMAVILAFTWIGAMSLLGHGPVTATWFSIKLLVFAGITLMALGLDFISGLITTGFELLESEGATPRAQTAITVGLNRIYAFVVVIYALSLAAAFLGTVKYPT